MIDLVELDQFSILVLKRVMDNVIKPGEHLCTSSINPVLKLHEAFHALTNPVQFGVTHQREEAIIHRPEYDWILAILQTTYQVSLSGLWVHSANIPLPGYQNLPFSATPRRKLLRRQDSEVALILHRSPGPLFADSSFLVVLNRRIFALVNDIRQADLNRGKKCLFFIET